MIEWCCSSLLRAYRRAVHKMKSDTSTSVHIWDAHERCKNLWGSWHPKGHAKTSPSCFRWKPIQFGEYFMPKKVTLKRKLRSAAVQRGSKRYGERPGRGAAEDPCSAGCYQQGWAGLLTDGRSRELWFISVAQTFPVSTQVLSAHTLLNFHFFLPAWNQFDTEECDMRVCVCLFPHNSHITKETRCFSYCAHNVGLESVYSSLSDILR